MKILDKILKNDIELLEIDNLIKLVNIEDLRINLIKEFNRLKLYTNLKEWNRIVSVCELLAHIGWQTNYEYEAHKSKFFNGNPYTTLVNQYEETIFLTALWAKRNDGFVIETERVTNWTEPETKTIKPLKNYVPTIMTGEFKSQRNWIQKSPIKIRPLIANSTIELNFIKQKIHEINKLIQFSLSNRSYGTKLQYIHIGCTFESEFNRNIETGFEIKRFTKKNGTLAVMLQLASTFGDLSQEEQIVKLFRLILKIIKGAEEKMTKLIKGYKWNELENDLKITFEKIRTDL